MVWNPSSAAAGASAGASDAGDAGAAGAGEVPFVPDCPASRSLQLGAPPAPAVLGCRLNLGRSPVAAAPAAGGAPAPGVPDLDVGGLADEAGVASAVTPAAA